MKSISVLCQETDPQKITLSKFQKDYFTLSNEVKTVAQNVVQLQILGDSEGGGRDFLFQ